MVRSSLNNREVGDMNSLWGRIWFLFFLIDNVSWFWWWFGRGNWVRDLLLVASSWCFLCDNINYFALLQVPFLSLLVCNFLEYCNGLTSTFSTRPLCTLLLKAYLVASTTIFLFLIGPNYHQVYYDSKDEVRWARFQQHPIIRPY
jgi:hypothetical protein